MVKNLYYFCVRSRSAYAKKHAWCVCEIIKSTEYMRMLVFVNKIRMYMYEHWFGCVPKRTHYVLHMNVVYNAFPDVLPSAAVTMDSANVYLCKFFNHFSPSLFLRYIGAHDRVWAVLDGGDLKYVIYLYTCSTCVVVFSVYLNMYTRMTMLM